MLRWQSRAQWMVRCSDKTGGWSTGSGWVMGHISSLWMLAQQQSHRKKNVVEMEIRSVHSWRFRQLLSPLMPRLMQSDCVHLAGIGRRSVLSPAPLGAHYTTPPLDGRCNPPHRVLGSSEPPPLFQGIWPGSSVISGGVLRVPPSVSKVKATQFVEENPLRLCFN